MDHYIDIRPVSGKGLGVFARSEISRGTLIYAEAPILRTSSNVLDLPDCDRILDQIQSQLSQHDRHTLFSLSNSFPDLNQVTGIVKTNWFEIDGQTAMRAIFPFSSFLNHSCLANAYWSWNSTSQQGRLYALQNVEKDQEITIAYFPDGIWFLPRNDRLAYIDKMYNFACCCQVCTAHFTKRIESDNRRALLLLLGGDIVSQVQMLKKGFLLYHNPARALAQCHEMLRVLCSEEITLDDKATGAFYNAFEICIAHRDFARAIAFARQILQMVRASRGYDADGVAHWEKLMRTPWMHEISGKTKWWWTEPEDVKADDAPDFEEWLWERERWRAG